MVSPASNIASSLLGSAAVSDVNDGPALSPKLPARAGDMDVDGRVVTSSLLRLAEAFTVNVNPPMVGTPPVASNVVMDRTDGLTHEPT